MGILNGLIHVGENNLEEAYKQKSCQFGITENLTSLGLFLKNEDRTPPRVDGRTLNYNKMEEQPGDINPGKFSYLPLRQHFQNKEVVMSHIPTLKPVIF